MSYDSELSFACSLLNALEYLTEIVTEHEEEYPELTAVIFHLLYGWILTIPIECPHCGKTSVGQTTEPTGNLDDLVEELDLCIKTLRAELDYEQASFTYPADYQI